MLGYLRVYLDEGRIAGIAYCYDGQENLTCLLGKEGDILEAFQANTRFFTNKWRLVPMGIDLQPQLAALHRRAIAQGILPFGSEAWGNKPCMDFQPILWMMNANARHRDSLVPEEAQVPPMFYGMSLEAVTKAILPSVEAALKNGWLKSAEEGMRHEHGAFAMLWHALRQEGPKWWRSTVCNVV